MAQLPKQRSKGSIPYAVDRVKRELAIKIDELEKRIKVLENGTKSVDNEVAKVTKKKDLTKAQLNDLCVEYGIDTEGFTKKQEFVDALKEKDVDLE